MPAGYVITSEIPEKDSFMLRKPKGVCAVITPWNFPCAIPLWLMGPSLIEGNTVVFKPSEDSPATGQYLVGLMETAGFPAGVVNLIHGDGMVGSKLASNSDVKVVLFTGSAEVGDVLKIICATAEDKFFVGEMGGKNALIVCEDAKYSLAVNAGILGAFKTTGQRCVSTSRIFIHRRLYETYCKKFVEVAEKLKFGNSLDEENFAGPLINLDAIDKVRHYNDIVKLMPNAEVVLDRGFATTGHAGGPPMNIALPFVYKMEHDNSDILKTEVFGPHVALIPYTYLDEAIEYNNDTPYGLVLRGD